jgi:adhesin transport system outer membrane protein
LTRQLDADRKTIAAFQKEYELGQRSLIDLLNAQNQYFNAAVSLTSARGVLVFADYQLLAAMGTLMEYLKSPPPVDVAPVDLLSFGLPAYTIPTVRFHLPQTGSEPLRVSEVGASRSAAAYASIDPKVINSQGAQVGAEGFKDRWPQLSQASSVPGATEWLAQQKANNAGTPTVIYGDPAGAGANSYAPTQKPHWLLSAFPVTSQ